MVLPFLLALVQDSGLYRRRVDGVQLKRVHLDAVERSIQREGSRSGAALDYESITLGETLARGRAVALRPLVLAQ